MASFMYNDGGYELRNGGSVNYASDTIEIILVKSTYTPNKDDTYTVLASAEISGITGYTGGYGGSGRKTLASKTITKDTTNDRDVYDAADPSAWTLGAGDTVGGAVIAKKGSADDTTAKLIAYIDLPNTTTDGSSFPLTFSPDGIFYLQR